MQSIFENLWKVLSFFFFFFKLIFYFIYFLLKKATQKKKEFGELTKSTQQLMS